MKYPTLQYYRVISRKEPNDKSVGGESNRINREEYFPNVSPL